MIVLNKHHRLVRLINSHSAPGFDELAWGAMDEESFVGAQCQSIPVKIGRLVPSGTTQSWMVNRVTWFHIQEFTKSHEYAHFMIHLLGERYPQEVVDFCWTHGLTDKLDLVVERINLAFPDAHSVMVDIEHDPESNQRWILVDAVVTGPAKEIRLRHRECVRRLLKLLPWPMSTLIRTTYTLA